MTVFDASALLAFVQGEPGRRRRACAVAGGVVGAANWSETAQAVRARDRDWPLARLLLHSYDLTVEPVTADDAEWAAERWRSGEGLSLGDRLCLALGERSTATCSPPTAVGARMARRADPLIVHNATAGRLRSPRSRVTTSRGDCTGALYHLGFGAGDLDDGTTIALLSGDPSRSERIASEHLDGMRVLSRHRGLDAFAATLPGGAPVVCATSGMGAPSMSIVVNELVQVGIRTIIRIGTSGSIQEHVRIGSVVIGSGALTNQGAALDIAPVEFPAVADPFLAVTLADAADRLGIDHHVGVMASTDTFYEGQERSASSANPHLLRRLRGMIDEYHDLGVVNFEMEAGTLFKMGVVYGFAAAAVVAIIAQRDAAEEPDIGAIDAAVGNAIAVAVAAADDWSARA